MAFTRPTIQELQESNETILATKLGFDTPLLPQSVAKLLSFIFAGGDHNLYGYIDSLADQVLIDTAVGDFLSRWASIWGVNRKNAAFAVGNVDVTGTNGVVIPDGTIFQREDGQEFESTDEETIAAGIASIPVKSADAGNIGNTDPLTSLAIIDDIAGLNNTGNVNGDGIYGGADEETDKELRDRLLSVVRAPAQGGNKKDFENWTLEISGVTRAWIFPNYLDIGNVGVTFVLDNSVPIIPNAAKVQEVQDYLDEKKPITSQVAVFAPVETTSDLTIKLNPNTTTVQDNVVANLEDLFFRSGPGETIYLSKICEAISLANGEINHQIILPIADIGFDEFQLPKLGTVTFEEF